MEKLRFYWAIGLIQFFILLPLSFAEQAFSPEDSIQLAYLEYEEKYNDCFILSQKNTLKNAQINQLKTLSIEHGEVLGYFSLLAMQKCTNNEFNMLMHLIHNAEAKGDKYLQLAMQEQIKTMKQIMFTGAMMDSYQHYLALSPQAKNIFNQMDLTQTPFNMVDAFERAWLSQ